MMLYLLIAGGVAAIILITFIFTILHLRRVVPANEVHIVQTRGETTSFGKGQNGGNTYYEWPTWLPLLGLTKVVLPVSVFSIELDGYEAYDKERVPFVVDLMAFFRIEDSAVAAERVSSFDELRQQLTAVVQGAVRTILAQHEIDQIMIDRSTFGDAFTKEVTTQLINWGVEPVKNIELMDIRDAAGSKVIANIMAKRTSAIETESRVAVAENKRRADIAEIEAKRETDLQREQAQQQVGQRQAERERMVGLAQEQSIQEVAEQQKTTRAKQMEISKVELTRKAEIARDVSIVEAEAQARTQVVRAEADRQKSVLNAEAQLETARREAEGIKVQGEARADAERQLLLAPVEAQISLAKEIGSNQGYQSYLLGLEQIKAAKDIGIEQAEALKGAQIKVFANAGGPSEGLSSISQLFSTQGGMAFGSMLEGFKSTEAGAAVVDKVLTPRPQSAK